MKRMKYFAFAAMLLCGTALFQACVAEVDNPVDSPDPAEQEAIVNRDVLTSHIESDARLLADNINSESFNATSQVLSQLLALIGNDKNFIPNMRTFFSTLSERKSLLNIYPVQKGSELAKMGYLVYIVVDTGGLGVQVIFDGKGGSRLNPTDHLEFIFPATVDGFGTTLFKVIVKNSEDCYQAVGDAQIPNVKRVGCITRLSKTITMTVTGFIDNQEKTLSQSVINLELPQNENSEYVSFDAGSFKLYGNQSAYLNDNSKTVLDYSLAMDGDQMALDYGYSNNGMNVINCNMQMVLPQKENFNSQMSQDAFNIADLKSLSVRFVNDMSIAGTFSGGAAFSDAFSTVIQNRQQTSSVDVLNKAVTSLNESCDLQITCDEMTKPEILKFCLVQKDGFTLIEPALKDLKSDDLIPLSTFLDTQTMEAFSQPFKDSFSPAGNASGSVLKLFSALMQMMPLGK